MDILYCQQLLAQVRSYEFVATSSKADGWQGTGRGTVRIEKNGPDTLLFYEEGFFETNQRRFRSSNVYRWQFKDSESLVSLEHLRFGAGNPVYLFDLEFVQANRWSSVCPHLCDKDEYHAQLVLEESGIRLEWTIAGVEESTRIAYSYRF
jgi:hypothetical protein